MGNAAIDLIIRIKNGYMAGLPSVKAPFSNLTESVLKKLASLGYIGAYQKDENMFSIELKYKGKQPAVTDVKIFSKPGRRYYLSYRQIKPVLGGLGHSILTTSKGILSGREASKQKLGGELLFEIW